MKKIILSASVMGAIIAPLGMTISCGDNSTAEAANDNVINFDSPIIKTWPQHNALVKLVEDWNKYHSNDLGFMRVKFRDTAGGVNSFGSLATTVNQLISSRSNNVPNLIINNVSEVNELASSNRELNLETPNLRISDFNDGFISDKTNLVGRSDIGKGLWSAPITVTTNMSLAINKPVLRTILNIIKKHGATVKSDLATNPIMNSVMQNSTNLNSVILSPGSAGSDTGGLSLKPLVNLWSDNNTSDTTSLNSLVVSDDTFKSYTSYYEFLSKSRDAMKHTEPLAYTGEYIGSIFNQIAYSKSGAGYDKDNFILFKPKPSGLGYSYPFLVDGSSEQTKFKETFEYVVKYIKSKSINIYANEAGKFRNGQVAFAQLPSVSALYSYSGGIPGYTSGGMGFNDIIYMPQISRTNSSDKKGIQSFAESALMGIHINKEEDAATKKFVEWIFKGNMHNGTRVTDFISGDSGYIIPLKESLTFPAISKTKKLYQESFKNGDTTYHKAAAMRSAVNIYESIGDEYWNFDGDQYTAKLNKVISDLLKKVKNDINSNTKIWKFDDFLEAIKKQRKLFEV